MKGKSCVAAIGYHQVGAGYITARELRRRQEKLVPGG